MNLPILNPSGRDAEYKRYSTEQINEIVYEYLFSNHSHRDLDQLVLNKESTSSRGYEAMNILHYLGLDSNFKNIFSNYSIEEAISILSNAGEDYNRIRLHLESYKQKSITNEQRIFTFLEENKNYYCDDCLATILGFNSRQNPNQVCNKSSIILKDDSKTKKCYYCNKSNKILRFAKSYYIDSTIKKINSKADEELIDDIINNTSPTEIPSKFDYSGQPKQRAEPVFVGEHKTYPRDRKVAINALVKANFNCEYDNTHMSFISKSTNKRYLEPHHLIPLAYSDQFENSLDIEENIVALCSNCHNEIHYGINSKDIITALFQKRKSLLEKVGIIIDLQSLLEMYK